MLRLVQLLELLIKLPEVHNPIAASQSGFLQKVEPHQSLGLIRL